MPLPREAYLLGLASLPRVGPGRMAALVSLGEPADTWEALAAGRLGRFRASPRMQVALAKHADEVLAQWHGAAARTELPALWQRHRDEDVGLCARGAGPWPPEVFDTVALPPELLLWRGDLDVLAGARVAIVGTRSCTRYGREVAFELGADLATAGVAVVSGLALGIDAAAHQGVLSVDRAPPIGVVACGLDVVYPRRNKELWAAVASRGVLLSERPLGSPPEQWRFASRNRVIAAFGDVVVVVESHARGGAVITAREAMAQGRTVQAVPGSLRSPASAGCHDLLADGAALCRDADDVLTAIGMSPGGRRSATEQRPAPSPHGCLVLDALAWQPATLEQVVIRTGLSISDAVVAIADLVEGGWLVDRRGWLERRARSGKSRGRQGGAS